MLEILIIILLGVCLMVSSKSEVKKSVSWVKVPQSQPVQNIEFQAATPTAKIQRLSFQLEIEEMREEYQRSILRNQYQAWKENCDAINRSYMLKATA